MLINLEKRMKAPIYIRPVETKDRFRSWLKQCLFPEPAPPIKIEVLVEAIKDTHLDGKMDQDSVLNRTVKGDHHIFLNREGDCLYMRVSLGLIGRGLRDYGWHLVRAVKEIRDCLPKDYYWRRLSSVKGRSCGCAYWCPQSRIQVSIGRDTNQSGFSRTTTASSSTCASSRSRR